MRGHARRISAGPRRAPRSARVGAAALGAFAALVGTALAASTDFRQFKSSPEATGPSPHGAAIADIDGDADQDIAVVNVSGGNVTILRNKGNGNFTEPNSSPIPAGSFPDAIAAADLDGDTDVDLAVANQVSDDVTILKNKGRAGSPSRARAPSRPATRRPRSPPPTSTATATVDLAVTNLATTDNVTILLNNGSGRFSESPSSPESAGSDPVSVAAGDLNGDGDQDLAVAEPESFTVTILRNDGSGDFGEPSSSPEFAGTFPQDIVIAQLDVDDDPDLAVANQGSDNVTVLINAGGHDFTEPVSSPESVGDRPLTLTAADFDLDGDDDLAVPTQMDDHMTILENGGGGDFSEPGSSPEAVGDAPIDVAAGDLDGDTDPDLVVANQNSSNVTVHRNR